MLRVHFKDSKKAQKDDQPLLGDRESLKGMFWKTVLNPCFIRLTASSLLWMIYTWSIWLLRCPTVNRWRRKSKKRSGQYGQMSFINLAAANHSSGLICQSGLHNAIFMHRQDLTHDSSQHWSPKLYFSSFISNTFPRFEACVIYNLFFIKINFHMCLTTLKVFQAPLGITLASVLILTPVLNSWILTWGEKKDSFLC